MLVRFFFIYTAATSTVAAFTASSRLAQHAPPRAAVARMFETSPSDEPATEEMPAINQITRSREANSGRTGTIAVKPTFALHFDRVFSYTLAANPTMSVEVKGDTTSDQLCLTSSYDMSLVANTELDINITLVDFHKDWSWGPTTVGSWSGQPIPKKCTPN